MWDGEVFVSRGNGFVIFVFCEVFWFGNGSNCVFLWRCSDSSVSGDVGSWNEFDSFDSCGFVSDGGWVGFGLSDSWCKCFCCDCVGYYFRGDCSCMFDSFSVGSVSEIVFELSKLWCRWFYVVYLVIVLVLVIFGMWRYEE